MGHQPWPRESASYTAIYVEHPADVLSCDDCKVVCFPLRYGAFGSGKHLADDLGHRVKRACLTRRTTITHEVDPPLLVQGNGFCRGDEGVELLEL